MTVQGGARATWLLRALLVVGLGVLLTVLWSSGAWAQDDALAGRRDRGRDGVRRAPGGRAGRRRPAGRDRHRTGRPVAPARATGPPRRRRVLTPDVPVLDAPMPGARFPRARRRRERAVGSRACGAVPRAAGRAEVPAPVAVAAPSTVAAGRVEKAVAPAPSLLSTVPRPGAAGDLGAAAGTAAGPVARGRCRPAGPRPGRRPCRRTRRRRSRPTRARPSLRHAVVAARPSSSATPERDDDRAARSRTIPRRSPPPRRPSSTSRGGTARGDGPRALGRSGVRSAGVEHAPRPSSGRAGADGDLPAGVEPPQLRGPEHAGRPCPRPLLPHPRWRFSTPLRDRAPRAPARHAPRPSRASLPSSRESAVHLFPRRSVQTRPARRWPGHHRPRARRALPPRS